MKSKKNHRPMRSSQASVGRDRPCLSSARSEVLTNDPLTNEPLISLDPGPGWVIVRPQQGPLREAIRGRIFNQATSSQDHQLVMTASQLAETRAEEAAEALQAAMVIVQKSGVKDKWQALSPDCLPLMF